MGHDEWLFKMEGRDKLGRERVASAARVHSSEVRTPGAVIDSAVSDDVTTRASRGPLLVQTHLLVIKLDLSSVCGWWRWSVVTEQGGGESGNVGNGGNDGDVLTYQH
jgi:hypothetical protein